MITIAARRGIALSAVVKQQTKKTKTSSYRQLLGTAWVLFTEFLNIGMVDPDLEQEARLALKE